MTDAAPAPLKKKLNRDTVTASKKANLAIAKRLPRLVNLAIEAATERGDRLVRVPCFSAVSAEEMRSFIRANTKYQATVCEAKFEEKNGHQPPAKRHYRHRGDDDDATTVPFYVEFEIPAMNEDDLIDYQIALDVYEKKKREAMKQLFGGGYGGMFGAHPDTSAACYAMAPAPAAGAVDPAVEAANPDKEE